MKQMYYLMLDPVEPVRREDGAAQAEDPGPEKENWRGEARHCTSQIYRSGKYRVSQKMPITFAIDVLKT